MTSSSSGGPSQAGEKRKKFKECMVVPQSGSWSKSEYEQDLKQIRLDRNLKEPVIPNKSLLLGIKDPTKFIVKPDFKKCEDVTQSSTQCYQSTSQGLEDVTQSSCYLNYYSGEYLEIIGRTIADIERRIENDLADYISDAPLTSDDYENDTLCFNAATSIEDIYSVLKETTNLQCVEMLRYLRWEETRLRLRETIRTGGLTNAPTAISFVKKLVKNYNDINHPVFKIIDKGLFIIRNLRSQVYIHPNHVPVTGRAAEAADSLDPRSIGPVEYDNYLFLVKNLTCDQINYVAKKLDPKATNRKTNNIVLLAALWKQAVVKRKDELIKHMISLIEDCFKFMTITAPTSTHFRAVSSQVLYQTKQSATIANHLSFRVLLTKAHPWHYYVLCGPIPGRLSLEDRNYHLKNEGMVRESTALCYPDCFKVYVNEKEVKKVFEKVNGDLYPCPIDEYCSTGTWHNVHVTFQLDTGMFQKGLVFHLIQGKIIQESYRKRES
jgi:hypothetical protein